MNMNHITCEQLPCELAGQCYCTTEPAIGYALLKNNWEFETICPGCLTPADIDANLHTFISMNDGTVLQCNRCGQNNIKDPTGTTIGATPEEANMKTKSTVTEDKTLFWSADGSHRTTEGRRFEIRDTKSELRRFEVWVVIIKSAQHYGRDESIIGTFEEYHFAALCFYNAVQTLRDHGYRQANELMGR